MRRHVWMWASMAALLGGCAGSSTGSGDPSSTPNACSMAHASSAPTTTPGGTSATTGDSTSGAAATGTSGNGTGGSGDTGSTAPATTGGASTATNGATIGGSANGTATGGDSGTIGATGNAAVTSGSTGDTCGDVSTTGNTCTNETGATSTGTSSTDTSTGTSGTTSAETGDVTSSTSSTGTTGTSTTGTSGSEPPPAPDLLTAGAWNDNLNFDWYLKYLNGSDELALPGLPPIPSADRLAVTVVDSSGAGLGGAQVTMFDGATPIFNTFTGASGVAYLFPAWSGANAGDALTIVASANGQSSNVIAHAGDASVQIPLATTAALPQALDVAFVIDTTGSMGDELSYIAVEISTISARIATRYPNVNQRFALVLYRDDDCGDEYELRTYDFSDLNTFQGEISNQSAGGGGDYEEEPEKGLAAATKLSWRSGNVARLVFHIADAPGHIGNETGLVSAIEANARQGVKIFPVAASGLDARGEYAMRTEAEVTGGSYLFLTDDSGIGNSHEIPHIFCYVVTHLSNALVRMVSMELEGKRIDPDPSDIIRFVGNPDSLNQCSLADGTVGRML